MSILNIFKKKKRLYFVSYHVIINGQRAFGRIIVPREKKIQSEEDVNEIEEDILNDLRAEHQFSRDVLLINWQPFEK